MNYLYVYGAALAVILILYLRRSSGCTRAPRRN